MKNVVNCFLTDGFPIPYGRNYNLNSPPRSEADAASSGANSFQFAPVTPDQGKQLQNHLSQMLNFLIDDRSSQETDKQEHLAISIRSEDVENRCDELLQNIVDSSSASISTTLKEKKISDEGDDRGIDLNKTPEQKTPKRRKHRPKVVTEEKPKRARKPAAPKNSTPNKNPSGKRKYVRKKDLKTSETQQANVVNEVTDHTVGSAAKSCRRALNFDLENATRDESQDRTGSHQAEMHQESQRPFNLNLDSQDTAEVNLNSQDTANPNPNRSTNQMPSGCILLQEQCSPITPPAKVRDHTLNVIARNVSMRRNRHIHGEDISRIPLQADTTWTNLGKARQLILQSTTQLVAKDMSSSDGKRGFKRGYCHNTEQIHPFTPNLDSPIYNSDSNKFGPVSSETHKKMKTGNGFHETIFSTPSCITAVKDCSRQVGTGGTGGVYTNGTTSQINGRLLNSYLEKESTSKKLINAVSGTAHDLGIHPMLASKNNFQKQQVSSEVQYPTQQTTGKRSHGVIQVQDLNSLTAMNNRNHMSTTPPKEASTSQNLETCFANMSAKKQPVEPTLSSQGGTDKVLQQQPKDASDSYKKSSMKARKEASTSHFLEACFANLSAKKQPVEPTLSNQGGTDKVLQQQHKDSSDGYKKSSTKARKEGSISPFLETCFTKLSAKQQPVEPTLSNQGGTDKVLQQQPKDASDGYKKSSTKARKEASTSHFLEACFANLSAKKQPVEPTLSNQGGTDKVLQQQPKDASDGYKKSSTKTRGMEKQKFPVSVDEITYQLKGLHINGLTNEHALVPYQGSSTIVPYEGFDPIKKRKSRPKVDLDPETDRIWKLLMGKEGSEGTEATNKDKEKWWEDEREVFRGRADSFIARMHLVQGDRRFSRWKGSVVDSVIGVFLTQNVSDHLSSSAFMSLAAKFPLRSTTINQTCYQNGTTVLVEEPDIQILETDGSIKCREKIGRQLVYNRSPITSCESTELRIDTLSSGTRNAANEYNRTADEEINSSYNYSHFFNFQTSGENRSISVSNSEAQDRTTRYKPNKNQSPTPINLLQTENATMFKGFYSQVNRSLLDERFTKGHQQSENPEFNRQKPRLGRADNLKGSSAFTSPINSNILHSRDSIVSPSSYQLNMTPDSGVRYFSTLGEESKSSLPSTASGFTEAKGVNHLSKRMGRIAEGISKTTAHYNDMLSFQAPTLGPYAFLSKHPTQEGNLKSGPQTGNYQHSISNHQLARSKTFQLEKTFVTERTRPAEAQTKSQTSARHQVSDDPKFTGQTFNREERIAVIDKQKCIEKESTEANEKEQIYNAGKPFSEAGTNISNARKGKAESEKGKAFDWDSLRKQAQSNCKRRERSKEAMDSLDYEALRGADVNEISNAIKERGMNNMLAERIKDFLNRLEREHGSIDLEWLRDVPPDKAKDYLLSVRGLGLKSVECVRLLTLHHLAFPVDTNVGRIAVRLGWVPLQPLPESLQLHLLELYPMLETIQKYLWPRLCKLDQRTLYELHYQMITFGKVFCTKSKPNCNACPMRGECRHFASAFASARLALPGPEERSIVGSAAHIATDRNPAVVIKHIALPLAENNTNKEAALIDRRCEPIVEEPTTPEPETEVSESDIEDAFYEDPDEIPMIKLNTEEFILNLHNYMQDNMELQEGDMSKALIALNPEAAAIPTPKLKNVSRLRTEHQVYELPDSHPLLKGLDKREPDDPSPYLLAIWTPGETPSSVQPPESTCKTQESGKLCNDKTCFSCNSTREANSQTVRGTLLIPCRTAMKGSFPLNGTYFQVNEMFADHESSLNPIDVPRTWLWNLSRRTVYFGTSVSTIFKGLSTEGIQYCFWRGFVCVRGFDQKTRAPRPLMARLHFPASKLIRTKNEEKSKAAHDSKRITGLQN